MSVVDCFTLKKISNIHVCHEFSLTKGYLSYFSRKPVIRYHSAASMVTVRSTDASAGR